MKQSFFACVLLVLVACSEDVKNPQIDFSNYAGIWVPYEGEDKDGVKHEDFTANNIFGVYAESVQLNDDGTFVPVTWFDLDNYTVKHEEAGRFTVSSGSKLTFSDGVWDTDMEFIIKKYSENDLWIWDGFMLLKLKREVIQ